MTTGFRGRDSVSENIIAQECAEVVAFRHGIKMSGIEIHKREFKALPEVPCADVVLSRYFMFWKRVTRGCNTTRLWLLDMVECELLDKDLDGDG